MIKAPPPKNEAGGLVKPRFPLSAYNLYYRFKRQKVSELVATGVRDTDAIARLILASPGAESSQPNSSRGSSSDPPANDLRRQNIRNVL